MTNTSVETNRFTLRAWDWLLLLVLCLPPALLISLEVGMPWEATLGEATVYFGLMTWIAYATGSRRWKNAGRRRGAGRWAFRIAVLLLALAAFVVGLFVGVGQSAAQAGTRQVMTTMSALRTVLDSDSDMDDIRVEFNRIAQQQLIAAESAPAYERPFTMVGAEVAIDTLRPQLEMLQRITNLSGSNVLSSESFETKESRAAVLERARAVLASGQATKAATESMEARAKQLLEKQPVQRKALYAFLYPLRRKPHHAPILAGDPAVNRWANAVIALYEHLDQTSDSWTIDPDGTLRTGIGKSDEVRNLMAAVEASLQELGAQADTPAEASAPMP